MRARARDRNVETMHALCTIILEVKSSEQAEEKWRRGPDECWTWDTDNGAVWGEAIINEAT